jgi:zinc transport system substrate-binding protein
MQLTRRRLVTATAGAVGLGALAGCTGGTAGTQRTETNQYTAQSSFFVFGDLTARVAGDSATADLLVPIGQHGHGWEPGPRVRESIADADLFIHGMTGFQPWVDRILPDLDADGSAVVTVDASAGVELLDAAGDHGHADHEGDEHGDDDHDEGDHEAGSHESDDHDEGDHETGSHESDDHSEDGHDEDGHADEGGHAGGVDPHFWMDPLRLSEAVDTVRRGLVDVDPGNADAYTANADDLKTRLADLHERIESVVAAGSTDVVLVAGHNSFRYLGERYGITVVSLTDVSPDDRPTTRDIERARELIDEHGLRYVCADPLESQRAAEQLVADTDAEAVLPLTAMPGLTEEWDDQNWGYADVVENVNLPTLERVLGG